MARSAHSLLRCACAAVLALFFCSSPLRAQCQSGDPCDVGKFFGPWDWSGSMCASSACAWDTTQTPPIPKPVEFYHGAVLTTGLHAGKVMLTKLDVRGDCTDNGLLETWLFDPASPETLIHIQHDDLLPWNMACAGNAYDRLGRLLMVGGPPYPGTNPNNRAFRFDPRQLGIVQYQQYPSPPTGPACSPRYIDSEPWQEIGQLSLGRYYATATTLTREPVAHSGCTDGIDAATIAIGGPPTGKGNEGNEVWELLDPDGDTWACPLVPEDYPGSFPVSDDYARKPDANKANPLMDSYPRAFQLSRFAQRQIFVAGDTRTDLDGKPPATVYGSSLTGKEAWTMKIPYADLDDPQLDWELWRTPAMQIEHDYANAVLLFRRNPANQTIVENRVLLLGGGQYGSPGPSSLVSVTDVVREFIPGADASGGNWNNLKTPLVSPRYTSNSVLLPDGTILVIGGSSTDTLPGSGGDPTPEFQPEIYDPGDTPNDPGSSKLMAASNIANWGPQTRVPRMYHSMAFLLPDGRIFVVGGRIHPTPSIPYSNSYLSGELFYPPYLYEGTQLTARPAITGVTLSNPSYQQLGTQSQAKTFSVGVDTPAGPIKKVSVIRISSVTHHFDSDQRYIELDFTGGGSQGASTLTVTAPREDMAPQGWYYLSVLEEKPGGRLVPSVARFVLFL